MDSSFLFEMESLPEKNFPRFLHAVPVKITENVKRIVNTVSKFR